ncbi:type VII secretion integral membrane protein EccD [Streptomyces sp. KhCrAH-43]|uniref:type VII secretion integral membrane protein EccD n=1 Tax=unclassified Streptomyces TaxID=2593676 RepID=UPI00037B2052|nr:type VII secretion integral membrane protein EccD [Streptomyces sp. KhCrAH-43]MYS37611.1 type VII secretion integral membrane protein EccD [Streptomyces sp. SID4920]MYX65798.1 type VII secretion integral membrane protein EccD [Streptomyces sp. SID8373]RAJ67278.1 type VII secretion integral membrane protein EccD [Streptomyces sp. KhCrAH-43]
MSPTATTGFRRVTVVTPDSRVDLALPEDIAAADVWPEILRLTGPVGAPTAPPGHHLVRLDGTVLDGARTLAAQRVLDGELLTLRPFAASLPPPVFDDVADAIASAAGRDRHLWSDDLLRGAAPAAGALLLLLAALVLWRTDPVRHDMHGPPGAVAGVAGLLLITVAGVRARVYADRATAVALGLGALPLVLLAGSGLIAPDPDRGAGRLQFLLGCATVLVVSAALTALAPRADAPFAGAAFLSGAGALAAFAAILTEASATATAAVCVPAALGLIAFLPGLSARFARLPTGYARLAGPPDDEDADPEADAGPVDARFVADRARRGHELLLGLAGGCAGLAAVAAAVAGVSGDTWGRLLALAAGLALLLRARLFRYTAQVVCLLVAGTGTLAALVTGLALAVHGDDPAPQPRTTALCAALVACAVLLAAAGATVPRKGLSPFWGRFLDLAESALLLSLVPLCLAVLDLYTRARALTG